MGFSFAGGATALICLEGNALATGVCSVGVGDAGGAESVTEVACGSGPGNETAAAGSGDGFADSAVRGITVATGAS